MNQNKKKGAPTIFKADMSKLREFIDSKQGDFEIHIEAQRKRERLTMEKGMVYWINT